MSSFEFNPRDYYPYVCPYCGKKFRCKEWYDYIDHKNCSCEKGPQLPTDTVWKRCQYCGEQHKDKEMHERHCSERHNPLSKICKFCGEKFKKTLDRIDHEATCECKDDEAVHKCPYCRERFVSHYYYVKHMEICPENRGDRGGRQSEPYIMPHHEYEPPIDLGAVGDIEHRFRGDPGIAHNLF